MYGLIYFLILFLVLGRDGVLFFWVQDGLEVIFYYFVFGNLGSGLTELKGTCDWVPFEFLCVIF